VKSKKDIKREYKERVKPAGVFQVKNTVNGKVLLEQIWLEALQPFGERGYNTDTNIRQA